jgi:hypothetical protein
MSGLFIARCLCSVFVVTNAGRLYFTHIEDSFAKPLFKKMDAWSIHKQNQPSADEKSLATP